MNGTPAACAARAMARSASNPDSAASPMGAMPKGCAKRWPSSVMAAERCDTSRSRRGTRCSRSNAARLARSETPSSTPPLTYAQIGRGKRASACASRSSRLRTVSGKADMAARFCGRPRLPRRIILPLHCP
jgi:hypothetical protein